jgi:hypothetical protein
VNPARRFRRSLLPQGFALNAVMEIERRRFSMPADCSYLGHAVTAIVSSSATVTNTTATILQSEQDVENL